MYFRQAYQNNLKVLRAASRLISKPFRFEFPIAEIEPKVVNRDNSDAYVALTNKWNSTAHESAFTMSFVDYAKSSGNFLVDADGNRVLDLTGHGGLLALGYNHSALVTSRATRAYHKFLNQSPNLSEYPPQEFPAMIRENVMQAAPEGLTEVYLTDGLGTLANETAIKLALLKYQEWHGDNDNLSVLGFQHSVHGRSLGATSASGTSKVRSSQPTYDWPTASLPNLQYPLYKYEHENRAEEKRCLDEVSDIISDRSEMGSPVGAVIVEPITSLGNQMGTPYFYKGLRKIASDHGIPFIIDETKTGVGKTGKFWAHEHWYMENSPDIVTFGSSAELSGVFTSPDYRPIDAHRFTNVSNGNAQKIISFKAITDFITKKNLLETTEDTGAFLKSELGRVNKQKRIFTNLRGHGTFIGWDLYDTEDTLHMQRYLHRNGILTSMIGAKTLGIRPSLTLQPKHAAHLRNALTNYHSDLNF